MESLQKKLRFWKIYIQRILPQCVIYSVLFYALFFITDTFFTPSKSPTAGNCVSGGDLAPGEAIPYKNWEHNKPHPESYYDNVFNRLYDEGYVSWNSKALSLDSTYGLDVAALRKIGVADVKGIPDMPSASFIVSGKGEIPFANETFDFEFFGQGTILKYWTEKPAHAANEIGRTLKTGGYLAVHAIINDGYSVNSFMNLFSCCMLASARKIVSADYYVDPSVYEFVFRKRASISKSSGQECTRISEVRKGMVSSLEPLVTFDRPGHWEGPWGNNRATLRYFSTMVDLSYKERYVYIDIGANSYNSSIGMWFEAEYPKQNKPFEIYAIEPDQTFHEELTGKPGLTLLPYAAWLKNETLSFEVYKMPQFEGALWDEMGYVQDGKESYGKEVVNTFHVPAFDFTEWLMNTVTNRDYVVVKMDVEGDEFKLVERMSEAGALCLIDEFFLECHYDYPGFDWGPKQKRPLSDCTDLFTKLRNEGCIVHQWW